MILNFTKNFQFTTKLYLNGEPLEIVKEIKLLGTFITNDLKWSKNTSEIVKKAYQRMQLLFRAASFTSNQQDLKKIYLTFIRSILEQSAVVWHSSLTLRNKNSLERVQKCAVKVILGEKYSSYENGLVKLNIQKLENRREELCLRFARNSLKNKKVMNMFPKNSSTHEMKKRKTKKFKLKLPKTKRYKNSAIPFMINLLNNDDEKRKMMMK